MNAGVLARLLATVRYEADFEQAHGKGLGLTLETHREIEAALEEALEAATKREDEERFAKENAAIVEERVCTVQARIDALDAEMQAALDRLRGAVDLLGEAVNP